MPGPSAALGRSGRDLEEPLGLERFQVAQGALARQPEVLGDLTEASLAPHLEQREYIRLSIHAHRAFYAFINAAVDKYIRRAGADLCPVQPAACGYPSLVEAADGAG